MPGREPQKQETSGPCTLDFKPCMQELPAETHWGMWAAIIAIYHRSGSHRGPVQLCVTQAIYHRARNVVVVSCSSWQHPENRDGGPIFPESGCLTPLSGRRDQNVAPMLGAPAAVQTRNPVPCSSSFTRLPTPGPWALDTPLILSPHFSPSPLDNAGSPGPARGAAGPPRGAAGC